jgi:hypothetical protein
MAIVQIPQQVTSSAQGLKNRVQQIRANDKCWTRTVAVSSLITGALLLARGRRKAGIAVTTLGAACALLEDPKDLTALWHSFPGYIDSGRRIISRFESLLEELSTQGSKIRSFLDNAQR